MDIGEINSAILPPQARNVIEGSNTTIGSKKAIESNDEFGSSLYIIIQDNIQGDNTGIWIEMDPGYQKDYEYIKNSFIIKKVP
ncbi:hypothetical protein [Methanobacterium sp. ACI-7]|uniref:hypothetical protein n=1 Tax=unclassified Methanobacterium TaxID=2627676 RepID=UPI0039C2F9C3